MSPRRRSAEKPKLRMDIYSNNDKNARQRGVVSDKRREIDRVIKKARREGDTTSQYWTKKLLEVEEKEPDRWRHSGYKELYVDSKKDSSDSRDNSRSPAPKKRSAMYSPSAPTSPLLPAGGHNSRRSSTPPPSRQNARRSISSDVRRGSPPPPRSRTDKFASSARPQRGAASSVSPVRRAAAVKSTARSPLRRSRSPLSSSSARRNKSAPQRASPPPLRRTRTSPPPSPVSRARNNKLSPRRAAAKSPLPQPPSRSSRRSPGSRLPKPDRAPHRSNDKLSPSAVRRKKSPKLARYKSVSRSLSVSPVRRRDKVKHALTTKETALGKRKASHRTKYRRSSSMSSTSPPPTRRKNLKQALTNDVLSSSDCSDSNCSMCRFEKSAKEKKKTKADRAKVAKRSSPPKEPRLKPRAALPRLPPPSSSRYARSRSLSVSALNANAVEERRPEVKRKKKSKKKDKKTVLKTSANTKAVAASILHNKRIKVESPSDESDESPSPKRITLSERFGKVAKWNLKKDVESNQRNIRVTAGDSYRVEELDVPLLEPFHEPPPLLLDGSWDDVRVRYTYYKDQGYLEDLSFQDYLKWEEWWYSYQEWLDSERLHSIRRRL